MSTVTFRLAPGVHMTVEVPREKRKDWLEWYAHLRTPRPQFYRPRPWARKDARHESWRTLFPYLTDADIRRFCAWTRGEL